MSNDKQRGLWLSDDECLLLERLLLSFATPSYGTPNTGAYGPYYFFQDDTVSRLYTRVRERNPQYYRINAETP